MLLIKNRLQHITGLGDVRQINLGLDLIRSRMSGTGRPSGTVSITRAFEVGTNFFRFVLFERAGMGLLLGDTHFRQYVKNSLALNFQLPG